MSEGCSGARGQQRGLENVGPRGAGPGSGGWCCHQEGILQPQQLCSAWAVGLGSPLERSPSQGPDRGVWPQPQTLFPCQPLSGYLLPSRTQAVAALMSRPAAFTDLAGQKKGAGRVGTRLCREGQELAGGCSAGCPGTVRLLRTGNGPRNTAGPAEGRVSWPLVDGLTCTSLAPWRV